MSQQPIMGETAFDVYSTDPGQQRRGASYPDAPQLLGPNGVQTGGGIYGSSRPLGRELSPQRMPPQQSGIYGSARPMGREISPQRLPSQQSFGQVKHRVGLNCVAWALFRLAPTP